MNRSGLSGGIQRSACEMQNGRLRQKIVRSVPDEPQTARRPQIVTSTSTEDNLSRGAASPLPPPRTPSSRRLSVRNHLRARHRGATEGTPKPARLEPTRDEGRDALKGEGPGCAQSMAHAARQVGS